LFKLTSQPEAVALLKKSIYYTAPRTHKTMPRMKAITVVAATVDLLIMQYDWVLLKLAGTSQNL
jgi:hypothetical protein